MVDAPKSALKCADFLVDAIYQGGRSGNSTQTYIVSLHCRLGGSELDWSNHAAARLELRRSG